MATRLPLNLFAIPLGLAGLGGTWITYGQDGELLVWVGRIVLALSALTWLALVVAYGRWTAARPARFLADVNDPVAAPFASLIVIAPMLLAAQGIYPLQPATGRLLVDVFLGLTVLQGSLFTGHWMATPMDPDSFHPGYFLPTVAGALIGSTAAMQVGQRQLAEVMFGLGVLSWLFLGSIILNRLLFRPALPTALIPTLAIQVAPAAVASLAWFSMHNGQIDVVSAGLGGYGLLMVLAQIRLIPLYRRLPFMPSTWAFTFSWAAVAMATIHWLRAAAPAVAQAGGAVALAALTAFTGAIVGRTLIALAHRELLPRATGAQSPAIATLDLQPIR